MLSLRKALELASEQGLDLVEVDARARPPVCKIVDYGRLRYEEWKRSPRAPAGGLEELRLRPKTDEHDRAVKTRAARRFLAAGHRVKLTVRFRGREIVHADRGRAQLDAIVTALADVAVVARPPTLEARSMSLVLAPA